MPYYRSLAPGQVARVHVRDVNTGDDVVVHESRDVLFEAPNWTMDGQALLVNGNGVMWSIGTEAGTDPVRIEHEGLPEANNDHVLDPDGQHIFLSAMDKHIYRGHIAAAARFIADGRVESPVHDHAETVAVISVLERARHQLGAR